MNEQIAIALKLLECAKTCADDDCNEVIATLVSQAIELINLAHKEEAK